MHLSSILGRKGFVDPLSENASFGLEVHQQVYRVGGSRTIKRTRQQKGKTMDLNAPNSRNASSTSPMFDAVLRIGLVVLLAYACARIVLPFAGILVWSTILAVMLYPLHRRLATRLGDRWSAAADRGARRRPCVGADGYRGDVARVVHLFASLQPAEPRPDIAAAARVARRHSAGWKETDRNLDARRHQPAGDADTIRSPVESPRGMVGVVRWWSGQPANYRSFFHLRSPPCSSPIRRAPPTLRDACSRA